MNRLVENFIGTNGEYWKLDAMKQLKEFQDDLRTGRMLIDEELVVRWNMGNIVPSDIVELLFIVGSIDAINVDRTNEARNKVTAELFKSFSKRTITEEEKFEMNANFDKGTVIVNVLTGKKVYVTK